MGRVTSDVIRGMSVTQSVRVGHIATEGGRGRGKWGRGKC